MSLKYNWLTDLEVPYFACTVQVGRLVWVVTRISNWGVGQPEEANSYLFAMS